MTTDTSTTPYKAKLIADFIASHHARLKQKGDSRPLMVSMQGPQGCGKSTLAAELMRMVEGQYGLKIAVASLDDFYLSYSGLKSLASSFPENALLSGRGPPGTHDGPLLAQTLTAIRQINSFSSSVALPVFDKSLHNGYGDRSSTTVPVQPPIDVFLLEGWSLGFEPTLSSDDLRSAWQSGAVAHRHPFPSIAQINDNLASFARQVYHAFDIHIAVRPESYDYVYTWRLQQEHHMKSTNGGKGMTDEEVHAFVDRYMPCYELYGEQKVERPSLVLTFGSGREVVSIQES